MTRCKLYSSKDTEQSINVQLFSWEQPITAVLNYEYCFLFLEKNLPEAKVKT